MKKYLAGAALATLGIMGLKKVYKAGFDKGVDDCMTLLKTAVDLQENVKEQYEKKAEES